MTNKMIDNRVMKLRRLEAEIADLEKEVDRIKDELKSELEDRDAEEMHTDSFIVRWTKVISSKFDSKAFKAEYGEDAYKGLCRTVESRRFSIAG